MDNKANEAGPLYEKLETARRLFRRAGTGFLKDERPARLLESYRKACRESGRLRVEAGIAAQCGICERLEGGSCCGAGIESRYDVWMLFINLILGAKLPDERLYADSCLFLGPQGCVLEARDVICVNYLCGRITERCEKEKIIKLQEAEGEELMLLFLINEEVKKKARNLPRHAPAGRKER